jgi:hypothetical protein
MNPAESITVDQLRRFGWESRKKMRARGPRYDNWEALSRSLGFAQWQFRHGITDAQLEEVRKGWDGAA